MICQRNSLKRGICDKITAYYFETVFVWKYAVFAFQEYNGNGQINK